MSKRRRHQQRSNSGVYKSDTRNQVYKSGESFSLPGSPDKEEIEYIASLPMDKLQQKLKAIVKENSTNRSDDGKENMTIDLFELHRPPQAGKKFALLKNRRGIPSAHGSGEVGKFSLSNPEEDEIRKVIMDRWEKRVVENEKYKDQNTELGRLLNTDSDDDVEPMEVDGGMNVNMRSVNRHGSYDLTPNERQYGLPFSGYPDQLDADLKECGYDVHFECEKAESIEQRRVLPPRDRRIVHRTGVNKYMHTNTYSRADDQVLNHEDSRTMEIDMLAMKRSKYHRLRDRRLREKEAKKQMELEEKERMEQYGTSFEDIDTIVNKIEPSEQKVNVSKKKKKRNKNDKNAKEIEASFGDTLDFIEPAHGYKPLVSCNSSDNDTVVPEEKSGKNKSKKKLKKTRSVDNEFRSGSSVSGASLPEKVSVSTKKKKEEKLSTVRKEVHKTTSDEKSVAKSTSVLQNSTKESDEKGKGKNKKKNQKVYLC